MRLLWLVTTAVCGVVLLGPAYGGWALLGGHQTAGALPDGAQMTRVSEVDRSVGPLRLAAQGRVEPVSEERDLAIGIVGTLAAVYVDEGDTIKQGQLLAELVNGDQRARIVQAEAEVRLRR